MLKLAVEKAWFIFVNEYNMVKLKKLCRKQISFYYFIQLKKRLTSVNNYIRIKTIFNDFVDLNGGKIYELNKEWTKRNKSSGF